MQTYSGHHDGAPSHPLCADAPGGLICFAFEFTFGFATLRISRIATSRSLRVEERFVSRSGAEFGAASALPTTPTDDRATAAAAMIGKSNNPKSGR